MNYPVTTLFPGTSRRSLRLAIKDAPSVPVFPPEQWASVNAFGAKGDGETDDSSAIQKAFRSGQPVVYFPSRNYRSTKRIEVPASVRRIELLGCKFRGGGFDVVEDMLCDKWIRITIT